MDADEARAKCAEMGLDEKVTTFVVGCFQKMNDRSNERHDENCSCGMAQNECERTTGEDGRIAWGQSWESVMDDLADAMGLGNDVDMDEHPDLNRVYDAFFQE